MSGFKPTNQVENDKLAETCVQAIEGYGPRAMVAFPERMGMAEAYAAYVLAACWKRRAQFSTQDGEKGRT